MKQILRNILLFGIATAMYVACGDGSSSGVSSNGTLVKGEFTVARGKKVYFSRGNLQYQASTNTWRFAEHQWDYVGGDTYGTVYENGIKCNNKNISATYDGWIDNFGWGTSGFNGKYPYMTSKNNEDYGDGENDIAGTNYDWGVYNKISNGGNKAGMWRTLTEDEWYYILHGRPHCEDLFSKGRVDGICGLILLPDEWDYSIDFSPRSEEYKTNDYTLDEWNIMESHGAVFLTGSCWSSTHGFGCDNLASYFAFDITGTGIHRWHRYLREFVRLVRDVE